LAIKSRWKNLPKIPWRLCSKCVGIDIATVRIIFEQTRSSIFINKCLRCHRCSHSTAQDDDPRFASWLVGHLIPNSDCTPSGYHERRRVSFQFRGALNSLAWVQCQINYGWAGSNKFRSDLQGYYKKHSGILSREKEGERERDSVSLFSSTIRFHVSFREIVHIHTSHARP